VTQATSQQAATQVAPSLDDKLAALRARLRQLGSVIIGFSGGVDSAFLLKVAVEELGSRALALTAVSASLPAFERSEAVRVAQSFGARHELVESQEIHNPAYAANPTNRCFYCKQELFRIGDDLRERYAIPHVAIGTNLDDLGGHRRHGSGQAAGRSPWGSWLHQGRCAKGQALGHRCGTAFACLSSRFPYGTAITEGRLKAVEACEALLREHGFRVFRVRYHLDLARIELGEEDLARLLEPGLRKVVVEGCKAAGFKFVSVDLEPYRSGRLNEP
jgi:uncharacterized protein